MHAITKKIVRKYFYLHFDVMFTRFGNYAVFVTSGATTSLQGIPSNGDDAFSTDLSLSGPDFLLCTDDVSNTLIFVYYDGGKTSVTDVTISSGSFTLVSSTDLDDTGKHATYIACGGGYAVIAFDEGYVCCLLLFVVVCCLLFYVVIVLFFY